jgi:hypothetical protein
MVTSRLVVVLLAMVVAVVLAAAQQGEDLPAKVTPRCRRAMQRFERLGQIEGKVYRDERVEGERDDAQPCRPLNPTAPTPTHRRVPHADLDARIGAQRGNEQPLVQAITRSPGPQPSVGNGGNGAWAAAAFTGSKGPLPGRTGWKYRRHEGLFSSASASFNALWPRPGTGNPQDAAAGVRGTIAGGHHLARIVAGSEPAVSGRFGSQAITHHGDGAL